MKTLKELRDALKTSLEGQITSLNGLMDKVPASVKDELVNLKARLNAQLESMPIIDAVPAAQEAHWALESFGGTLIRMQEYASGLMARLSQMADELGKKTTALAGFETQVQSGDLLEKSKVKELCDAARDEGAKASLPQIIDLRKKQVELAGLPMPADDLLGQADFVTRLDTAKANLVKLTAKGFKVGGKGDKLIKESVWLGATEFAGKLDLYSELIGGSPGGGGGGTGDPLLGNPPGTDKKPEARKRMVV